MKRWTDAELINEATKYPTRKAFLEKNPSAYVLCLRRKLQKQAFVHMLTTSRKWSKEELAKEALKYQTRTEFYKNNPAAYGYAQKRKMLDDICGHMVSLRNDKWNVFSIHEIAKKYKTRFEFQTKDLAAYTYAHRYKLLDVVCSHMDTIKRSSTPERQILDWIKSLGLSARKYYFPINTKGHRKEIDIFIPELKIGIEYCGLYWHSDARTESPRQYHYQKMQLAKHHGIRLITVFEDEWLNRREQVKGRLMSIFGLTKTVYARKTVLRPVDKSTAARFYDLYHIQGKALNYVYGVGLYDGDDLVGVCTLGKHHRGGSSLVLDRLCFKTGITVVGGASKLLAGLTAYAKTIGHKSIISWSDNRWSEGNVYKKLGFILDKELPPDYSYVKNRKRFSKQSKNKKNLLKEGGVGSTEFEMAKSLKYSRIWDCGKKRWKLSLV